MKREETRTMRGMAACWACAWLLGMVTGLGAGETLTEEAPAAALPAETKRAVIAVELTYSPDVLPLDEARLSELWNSAVVRGRAIEEVFGAVENRPGYVDRLCIDVAPLLPATMGGAPGGGLAWSVGLSVQARLGPGPTTTGIVMTAKTADTLRPVLERATVGVEELLRQAHTRNVENLSERLKQAEDMREAALRTRQELTARQRALVRDGGWGTLDRAVLSQTLHGLRRQQQELGIEAAVMQVRREAIQEEIARMADAAARAQADSPVAAQLERVLSLRKEALDHARRLVDVGRLPASEAAEAQEAYLLAEIELEKHRSGLSGQGGMSEQLAGLNAQLSEATIKTAELEVRSRMLEEAASRLESVFAMVDEYERYELEARGLATTVEETGCLRDQIAARLRAAVEPSLRIVEGSTTATQGGGPQPGGE